MIDYQDYFLFKLTNNSTGDLRRAPSTAIAVLCLDGEHGLLSDLHGCDPQVPPLDHLGLAQVEAELVPPVSAGVKLGSVCEGADIVNKDLVSSPGAGISFTGHLNIAPVYKSQGDGKVFLPGSLSGFPRPSRW